MITTDNDNCNSLVRLLSLHGVKEVVLSPGSRNSPLAMAFGAQPELNVHSVTDERTAAFIATGIASTTGRPVAVCCTSGTALYNYAPAVAEAYYRQLPIIVVSADRPARWIGQDDSQTLVQPGALSHIVKKTYALSGETDAEARWYNDRETNDAMLEAMTPPCGPVHINLPIEAPFNGTADTDEKGVTPKLIRTLRPAQAFTTAEARRIGKALEPPRRVLVVCGFMPPDDALRRGLRKLAGKSNIAVVAENIANLGEGPWVTNPDPLLASADGGQEKLRPDLVLTLGGAIVSGRLKAFLRRSGAEHWHIGPTRQTVDCYRLLTTRIDADPALFVRQLASAVQLFGQTSDYGACWREASARVSAAVDGYVDKAPWCDLKAMTTILHTLDPKTNLHLSNGMTVRYAQMTAGRPFHRTECNRGVSGIDGSTSTAIGASLVYKAAPTVLVSGDMSAQYDLGALASGIAPARFKMIVIANGGGTIFRVIPSTRDMAVRERFLTCPPTVDWEKLAGSVGFIYYEATDEATLTASLGRMMAETARPGLLAVRTDDADNAGILLRLFDLLKRGEGIQPTTYDNTKDQKI